MTLKKKEPKMTKDAPMYVYATEMVSHYYERLGLKGKRVLTVVGSGDQVINALYYGASEVVGYDINRNALYICELKMAAIKTLSYQVFYNFLLNHRQGLHTIYTKRSVLCFRKTAKHISTDFIEKLAKRGWESHHISEIEIGLSTRPSVKR